MSATVCPLCEEAVTHIHQGMKGYVEGAYFDVYECDSCNASFVDPRVSDSKVYDSIYAHGKNISGYMRYYRFLEAVKQVKKPLQLLAESENVYWAVQQALIKNFSKKEGLTILEVGSGLGYLTYSLNKEGYRTLGLDISKQAVEEAAKNYGEYYTCEDLFTFAKEKKGRYDAVIMTELLEHVEDPKKFIEAAISLVKEGGKIIITTPNKDTSPKGLIWQNDVPPVHLWWFSERSITRLAHSFGKSCSFIDFTSYTTKYFEYGVALPLEAIESNLPRLTKSGEIFKGREVKNIKSFFFSALMYTRISNILRRIKPKTISVRSSSMCAIIA